MISVFNSSNTFSMSAVQAIQQWADDNLLTPLTNITFDRTNNWFWEYAGEPTILIGGSSDDNLFLQTGTTLTDELDVIVACGGNYVRNTMDYDDVKPFGLASGGKWDLDTWNDDYWNRFEFFLQECYARSIIVQVELWDRFNFYSTNWSTGPWAPDNNINYTNASSGFADEYPTVSTTAFFYTIPAINDMPVPLVYQELFIEKLMSYSLNYPNIIYTMDNETGVPKAWGEYWSAFIKNIAANAGKTILTTEMWNSWDLETSIHKQTWDNIPAIYDYTDVSQNNHYNGDLHWSKLAYARNYIATTSPSSPIPINNTKIYGYNNSSATFLYTEEGINRFWSSLLGGCASVRFHRDGGGGYGLGIYPIAQTQITVAREIGELTRWQDRVPDTNHTLLSGRSTDEAYVSYKSDDAYVVYFYRKRISPSIGNVTLDLTGSTGTFDLTWFNLDDGTSSASTTVDNPYLEVIDIPPYNSNDTSHFLIDTVAKFSQTNFDNTDYNHFYVVPDNYNSLSTVSITTDGTSEIPRTISLYDPTNETDNSHPAQLAEDKLAKIPEIFLNASYWVLDRMSVVDRSTYHIRIRPSAEHNIINRMFADTFSCAVMIENTAHNNTVQNGRFQNGYDPDYDGPVAIQISCWDIHYFQVHNTKIINNEFLNVNDGFQIVRSAVTGYTTAYQDGNAEGTIVNGNTSYLDDRPYMENFVDIKCGSDSSINPIVISDNIAWGYRRHPDYVSGPYPPARYPLVCHYSPKNVIIEKNVFYDSTIGMNAGAGDSATGFGDGLIDGFIRDNVFYNCGDDGTNLEGAAYYAFKVNNAINTLMSDNYIIDSQYYEGDFDYNAGTSIFEDAKIVNPYGDGRLFDDTGSSSTFTTSLNTATTVTNDTWNDFVFIKDKFTNAPEVITLTQILDPNGTIVSPITVDNGSVNLVEPSLNSYGYIAVLKKRI